MPLDEKNTEGSENSTAPRPLKKRVKNADTNFFALGGNIEALKKWSSQQPAVDGAEKGTADHDLVH